MDSLTAYWDSLDTWPRLLIAAVLLYLAYISMRFILIAILQFKSRRRENFEKRSN